MENASDLEPMSLIKNAFGPVDPGLITSLCVYLYFSLIGLTAMLN